MQLGPKQAAIRLFERAHAATTRARWRKKITQGFNGHSLESIKRALSFKDAQSLFETINKNCTNHLFLGRNKNTGGAYKVTDLQKVFQRHIPSYFLDKKSLIADANKVVSGTISLFKNETTFKDALTPNWHQDPLATHGDPTPWYKEEELPLCYDTVIPKHEPANIAQRFPDVRTVWELSRLQHLLPLGLAFRACSEGTPQEKQLAKTYKTFALEQIENWIEQNPFMKGINWTCTMEVAIRASVLVWLFDLFEMKEEALKSTTSDKPEHNEEEQPPVATRSEQLICSLYDHLVYVRQHPETSATPNNHYITDLVGHLYLSNFFGLEDEQKKVLLQLKDEFEQQVLPDATSYEGSTSYHRLVTELFAHYLALKSQIAPKNLLTGTTTLKAMLTFLERCTQHDGSLVQIGDNDSSKFIIGITTQPAETTSILKTDLYPHFGLGITTYKKWYSTVRHPTFATKQPTGHFHCDTLGVTVSHGHIQLFIDPGTALYTGNPALRNKMRNASSHTTFYEAENASVSGQELFMLNKKVTPPPGYEGRAYATVHSEMLSQVRGISFCDNASKMCIQDQWVQKQKKRKLKLNWSWIIHPEVKAVRNTAYSWNLVHPDGTFVLASTLPLALSASIYSTGYQQVQTCPQLVAELATQEDTGSVVTTLTAL